MHDFNYHRPSSARRRGQGLSAGVRRASSSPAAMTLIADPEAAAGRAVAT